MDKEEYIVMSRKETEAFVKKIIKLAFRQAIKDGYFIVNKKKVNK